MLRRLALVFALSVAPVAVARAGLFGADAPGRIPVPAKDFRLRVEDRAGVVVDIGRASFDGEVFLFGNVGLAVVTVPFETVRSVSVGAVSADGKTVPIHVSTASGEEVDVVVDADRYVYGRAIFGNYRIEIGDVRLLTLR